VPPPDTADAAPRVSIVVNNYNYARYLPEAVDSALAQDWGNVEVIVVDDGSTDTSRQIIAGYGERITAILQENAGQAAAMNAGFARARGDLVIFLDADDRLHPEAAARVAAAWQATPNAGKLHCLMAEIDAEGRANGTRKPPPYVTPLSGDLRRHYLTFPDDVWRMPTSGNAFPARVLHEILPIPEDEYRGGADTYLAHLAPLYGPVVLIAEIAADYRVHGANRYQLARAELNLDRIRRNVSHAAITNRHLAEHAARLGLTPAPGGIGSVSFYVNRMISLKLEPERHGIAGDRPWSLVRMGSRAAMRRFDVSGAMRLLYVAWFAGMLASPRPIARRLATWMVFPETRRPLNRLIGRMGRPSVSAPSP